MILSDCADDTTEMGPFLTADRLGVIGVPKARADEQPSRSKVTSRFIRSLHSPKAGFAEAGDQVFDLSLIHI